MSNSVGILEEGFIDFCENSSHLKSWRKHGHASSNAEASDVLVMSRDLLMDLSQAILHEVHMGEHEYECHHISPFECQLCTSW